MKNDDKPDFGGAVPKMCRHGGLRAEWKKCGKFNCRCARGQLHGPYYYRHWRENGRQRKAYVARQQLEGVRLALAANKGARRPFWTIRQALADLRRMEKEVIRWPSS